MFAQRQKVMPHSAAEFEIVLYDNVDQIPRDLLPVVRLTKIRENSQKGGTTLMP